ncbi:MAG: archease [Thermodesulfobacteriota bacterium]
MPYRYLEDIVISDVVFEAWGETLEETFVSAGDATQNVMVQDLDSIRDRERRPIRIEDASLEMLLFHFLLELIYFKDAEELLLRVPAVEIRDLGSGYSLHAEAYGERLDPKRHTLLVDVKAVTLHRFSLKKTAQGWEASVVLDI